MDLVMDVCEYLYVFDFGKLIVEGSGPDVMSSEVVKSTYLGDESNEETVAGKVKHPHPVARAGNGRRRSMNVANDACPALELQAVSAGYGATAVLHDINLSVRPASVVALLGTNGAGKTMLLHAAAGLIRPTSGRVLVNGAEITGERPNKTLVQACA
jgi:ABC-type branched-subunit amino acid transport system ATPase component